MYHMGSGFGRLTLNPYAPPFFPNNNNTDSFYYNPSPLPLQPPTNPLPLGPLPLQAPTHFMYCQNPAPPTHVINVFSPPPPPQPQVVVSVGDAAPHTPAARARRSVRRRTRLWSGDGGCRKQPLMRVDPHGRFTTVMIRNIPNQYTEMVKDFLDQHCSLVNNNHHDFTSAYDFLYLPIDFGTKVNKGFAFVNFTEARAVWRFHQHCADKSWAHFKSSKRCDVTYAKLQGSEALEKHFSGMILECPEEEYLPVRYTPARDGSGKAVTEKTVSGRSLSGPSRSQPPT